MNMNPYESPRSIADAASDQSQRLSETRRWLNESKAVTWFFVTLTGAGSILLLRGIVGWSWPAVLVVAIPWWAMTTRRMFAYRRQAVEKISQLD